MSILDSSVTSYELANLTGHWVVTTNAIGATRIEAKRVVTNSNTGGSFAMSGKAFSTSALVVVVITVNTNFVVSTATVCIDNVGTEVAVPVRALGANLLTEGTRRAFFMGKGDSALFEATGGRISCEVWKTLAFSITISKSVGTTSSVKPCH